MHEDAPDGSQCTRIAGEQQAQLDRHREYPLSQWDFWDHPELFFEEMLEVIFGGLRHVGICHASVMKIVSYSLPDFEQGVREC